jgi:hypothetical protein
MTRSKPWWFIIADPNSKTFCNLCISNKRELSRKMAVAIKAGRSLQDLKSAAYPTEKEASEAESDYVGQGYRKVANIFSDT